MVVEPEELFSRRKGRYNFSQHFEYHDGQFRYDAAFTVLKLMEISVIYPEKAEALAVGMAIFGVSHEYVISTVGLDDYARNCGPTTYQPEQTYSAFLQAQNELNRMHRELQLAQARRSRIQSEWARRRNTAVPPEINQVSTQEQLFEKAKGLVECPWTHRTSYILRHREEFIATHSNVA